MRTKAYSVYVMINKWNTTSYIGVTSNLARRIQQHLDKQITGFTDKYNINKLVYVEQFNDINEAIAREKQLKKWSKDKKMNLIKKTNPSLDDISGRIEG